MVEERRYFCDYLGKPDMNMAYIAKGFGVEGEVANNPIELQEALKRARRANQEGKSYLIDAQVVRTGVGWEEEPWTPSVHKS
jgi:thiamine pyrophosphate-dependent acetolactate synthase large subunit-like protein